MITKRQLKDCILKQKGATDTLRHDMAMEFVERDKKLASLEERAEDIIDAVLMNKLFLYGLCKALGVTQDQFRIAGRYVETHLKDFKAGTFHPVINDLWPEMEKEEDLFSQAEEQPEKRSRKDIKDEAFARNLISLDALRVRYKVSKDTINAAAAYLGLKLHAIEGSECKYIDRSKIGEIKDYLTKA